MPCGHGGLCYRCGLVLSRQERNQQCPICRGLIEQVLKISKCKNKGGTDQIVFIAEEGIQRIKKESSPTDLNGSNNDSIEQPAPLLRSIVPSSGGVNSATVTPLDEDQSLDTEQQRTLEMRTIIIQRESRAMINILSEATSTVDSPIVTNQLTRPPSTVTEEIGEESKSRYAELDSSGN
jgi:hypothetical protein